MLVVEEVILSDGHAVLLSRTAPLIRGNSTHHQGTHTHTHTDTHVHEHTHTYTDPGTHTGMNVHTQTHTQKCPTALVT